MKKDRIGRTIADIIVVLLDEFLEITPTVFWYIASQIQENAFLFETKKNTTQKPILQEFLLVVLQSNTKKSYLNGMTCPDLGLHKKV